MECPKCNSQSIIKYGSINSGKQRYQCKDCGRQFVENPQNKIITKETKDLIEKLLLEKIPLAGIVRTTGVSKRWLQYFINKKYASISQKIEVKNKNKVDPPSRDFRFQHP